MDTSSQNQMAGELPSEPVEGAATLEPNPLRRRRRRRRKRSPMRRFLDGMIPFAVLVGLGALAAGLVGVVETGAASASKKNNRPRVHPMRQHVPAELRSPPVSQNRVVIWEKTALEGVAPTTESRAPMPSQEQDRLQAELGFLPPSAEEDEVSLDDVIDWGLIEESQTH